MDLDNASSEQGQWSAKKDKSDQGRWSVEKANRWYREQPFLFGANYVPSDAVNQLEMWQKDTFNPDLIEKELAMAKTTGMNFVRVFLHDLLWEQDKEGFKDRID